ncbi:hypothetical protein Ccrd_006001 [Cynara cardunculus var. scolymus]|uniref:Uncharacterized protein n=1 Tax=Cynara cardunculus var. scolymus TaxID=59895 RepID=A0A103XJY0_CYNCS|nr:hypothetical protein Ccrd_006001 [Cynara cardunculus var. scolymus]
MDGGVTAEQGTVTCASWIRRPEDAHLVALGKSKHGDLPASFQIFSFDRLTTSLSSSPSVSPSPSSSLCTHVFFYVYCLGAGG